MLGKLEPAHEGGGRALSATRRGRNRRRATVPATKRSNLSFAYGQIRESVARDDTLM
jgi:hypothetical protein